MSLFTLDFYCCNQLVVLCIITSFCNLSKFGNQWSRIMKLYKCQLKLDILFFIKYFGIISRIQKVCGSRAGIVHSVERPPGFKLWGNGGMVSWNAPGMPRLSCLQQRGQQVLHQRWILGNMYHIWLQIRLPTLVLKPRGNITRSPKRWHQWPHKKDVFPPKIIFKKNL